MHWPAHKWTCSKKIDVQLTHDGRGAALFARAAFDIGDELVRDAPLIKMPNEMRGGHDAGSAEAVKKQACLEAFAHLPETRQHAVMALSDAHGNGTVWGIMKTNAIPLGKSGPGYPSAFSGLSRACLASRADSTTRASRTRAMCGAQTSSASWSSRCARLPRGRR